MQNTEKTSLIRNASLFSKLRDQEIETVAHYSRYYSFASGQAVFNEGSVCEELYIIKSGEVVISKPAGDGKVLDIARFVEGESFGELGLLDSKPRNETATATADGTEVLIFPERGVRFRELLARHPAVFAQFLHKLLAIMAGRIRSTNTLISERSPLIQDLKRQLLSDELTGLYNRTFLDEELDSLLPGYGPQTSFLMIKPDQFKTINDTYGHDAGDQTLKLLASTLRRILRETDVGVRYRGNELAAVLPGAPIPEALPIAETIRREVSAIDISHLTGGAKLTVTVSIGVALFPTDAAASKQLVEKAFESMFKAREEGGDRIRVAGGGK